MTSKYLDMVRGQRRRPSAMQFTSKTLLAILAIISMGGSAAYWWGVQSQLTDNQIVAIASSIGRNSCGNLHKKERSVLRTLLLPN